MRKLFIFAVLASCILSSCKTSFNQVYKSTDYDYKYEAAKEYYIAGQYSKCYQILEEFVMMLKGTEKGEESLFMLAMSYYKLHDYETAVLYFDRYFKTYAKGIYAETAKFYSGKASYMQSPDIRLDQSPTITAINSLTDFIEIYPYSKRTKDAFEMIDELRDRLALKEYQASKLYYNLGSYTGNCYNGGSNYQACIITAENALKTYPSTPLREEFYIMILRARYHLAVKSVAEKQEERYRETIEEYYGFKNEFPDSKYMKEAERIFTHAVARQPMDKDKTD
ncbi:MAG: outer membrane protein assembly factor BamD [Bacteroidaceae bacterium]|nr:outer membrane protein assembly factor BamD [Bacteroidaceae bacterium]